MTIGSTASVIEAYSDNLPPPLSLPTFEVVPGTALPWWEYLACSGTGQQGIYYQIDGTRLSVEFLLQNLAGLVFHFIVSYESKTPGSVGFYYFSAGDGGANATIGVTGLDSFTSKITALRRD